MSKQLFRRIGNWWKRRQTTCNESPYDTFAKWKSAKFHFLNDIEQPAFPESDPLGYGAVAGLVATLREAMAQGRINEELVETLQGAADLIIKQAQKCWDYHSGPNSFRYAWKWVERAVCLASEGRRDEAVQAIEQVCAYYTQCAHEFFAKGRATDVWVAMAQRCKAGGRVA